MHTLPCDGVFMLAQIFNNRQQLLLFDLHNGRRARKTKHKNIFTSEKTVSKYAAIQTLMHRHLPLPCVGVFMLAQIYYNRQ